MTPEERERFAERMRQRGLTPADGQPANEAPSREGGGAARNTRQAAAQNVPARSPQTSATTFDALFGPLAPTESVGQLWLYAAGQLQRVRVRLGVSDGQQTELLQAADGALQEGAEVVTSVTIGSARQTAAPAAGNAFPGLGGGRQGGFGGGGRGGGRGQ